MRHENSIFAAPISNIWQKTIKDMNVDYRDCVKDICDKIHTGHVDFSEPRSEASMPSQASSEFITNKQQGDWAEDVIFRAINGNSHNVVAVKYGQSDDLIAGDAGFEEFFRDYQTE